MQHNANMQIGEIQLTPEAIPEMESAAVVAVIDEQKSIGEKPDDPALPVEELEDKPLSREEVEGFLWEIKNQPNWRRESDKASDYYDGNQLSAEVVEIRKSRGQPELISNFVKPAIDTVLGMEAKTRTDWRVRSDDDEACSDDLAEALSVKLKHAEIESRADRAVSDAYAAQCKAGIGWVEVSSERDPFKCPYRVRYVHRREIFWDWRAEQPDLSDARYLIRRRWIDLDHAIAMMPQYASLFRASTSGWAGFDPLLEPDTRLVQSFEIERDTRLGEDDWLDIVRQRICLYEIWYRKWVRGHVMTIPGGKTVEVDFSNPLHSEAILSGIAKVRQATFQRVRLAWYAGPHFLYDVPSPYRHHQFPYVPFFGYREDLTGAPYGLIRAMISPQDEINARKSRMLWSLNSRRVITDGDAVINHEQTAAEIARHDAYVILNEHRKPTSQFHVESGGELAAQQFQVLQESKQEIAETSGIHKSMMGQASSATSGLAINSLIEQGINTLAEINDNYRFARRLVGEMLFDMLRQHLMEAPSSVTIGDGVNKKVVQINTPAIDEMTGQPFIMNDVSRVKTKVVLDDIPSTPTFRMQQLQMLTEITKSLPPQLQGAVADFVIEATDFPKRHEVAERIRAAVGIQDPEQQQMAQQEQMAQQQQMAEQENSRQQRMFLLGAAEQAARIRKLNAEAERASEQAKKVREYSNGAPFMR